MVFNLMDMRQSCWHFHQNWSVWPLDAPQVACSLSSMFDDCWRRTGRRKQTSCPAGFATCKNHVESPCTVTRASHGGTTLRGTRLAPAGSTWLPSPCARLSTGWRKGPPTYDVKRGWGGTQKAEVACFEPGFRVKEGLSWIIFRAITLRKTRNLALPWLESPLCDTGGRGYKNSNIQLTSYVDGPKEYGDSVPIVITENGVSDHIGNLDDMHRIYFFKHYLNQLLKGNVLYIFLTKRF